MQRYFKIGPARCKSMGIPEGTVFPVKRIETNSVGGKGFDATVFLDTGDGWLSDVYVGKDLEMFVARGEFVDIPNKEESTMKRKISEQINDAQTKRAVIYRDAEFNEYVVKFYTMLPNGMQQYHMEADYHTDDKADAIATAIYEVSKV